MEIDGVRVVDVSGFEGYYVISEKGVLYKIRPNLQCGFDVIKQVKPSVSNKGKKNESLLVCLTRNGVHTTRRLQTVIHDSFFPERTGLKYRFSEGLSIENITLLDTKRPTSSKETEEQVLDCLRKKPKLHTSEVARICKVGQERVRQIKRKYNIEK